MRWTRLTFIVAMGLVGCGFDTGGVASGGASVGTLGGETSSTGADSASGMDSFVEEGGEASTGSATTASTTNATTASTTVTTDPTAGESTGASMTTDPTAESGGSSSSAGSTAATIEPSSSSTGGDGENFYPPCNADVLCDDPTQTCSQIVDGLTSTLIADYCSSPCVTADDCPMPGSGTATLVCTGQMPVCRLDCEFGTCPNGMDCYHVQLNDYTDAWRCAYTL